MPTFHITPRAREDLKDIGRYTEWQWGKSQRNTYLKDFEIRFKWLAENPRLGKYRSDISEGYYSYPQGQHVIFYLIGQECIEIIGIPHKEMDIVSYFLTD
tara:strand:+ start:8219 stop:8518 length:300 start_codon:yes stop_codon:yes gene_type:complete